MAVGDKRRRQVYDSGGQWARVIAMGEGDSDGQ